jgi:hypothetical protein
MRKKLIKENTRNEIYVIISWTAVFKPARAKEDVCWKEGRSI